MGHAERLNPMSKHTEVTLPADLKDRLGRNVHEGDTVAFDAPPSALLWDVEHLGRDMDPRAPLNQMRLRLVSRTELIAPAHSGLVQVVRVRTAEEAGKKTAPRIVEIGPPTKRSWWRRMLTLK